MIIGIHPNYREVLFVDLSNGFKFVTRSCVNTKEMGQTEDGRELPMYKLDTSSESHPFYTGTQKSVDNMGGRVERFRNRFGKTTAAAAAPAATAAAAEYFFCVFRRQRQPGQPCCLFVCLSCFLGPAALPIP